MSREYAVASRLQGAPVPVARTVTFDSAGTALGAPMTVVEYVDGLVIRDRADLAALTDAQVEAAADALVSVLVDLHAVDYQAIGLGEFGRPDGFLARQVALWARQWERVKTRELPDVAALHAALSQAVPAHSDASIIHGDLRIDNTILDAAQPDIVRAVVDWELSTLGDPLTGTPPAPAATSGTGTSTQHWPTSNSVSSAKELPIVHCAARTWAAMPCGAAEVTAEFMAAGLRALS